MNCGASVSKCSDNTCLCYNKHYICIMHPFHIGDRVSKNSKLGYVYSCNNLGTKLSLTILYDDNSKEAIFSRCNCDQIVATGDARDLDRVDPRL